MRSCQFIHDDARCEIDERRVPRSPAVRAHHTNMLMRSAHVTLDATLFMVRSACVAVRSRRGRGYARVDDERICAVAFGAFTRRYALTILTTIH